MQKEFANTVVEVLKHDDSIMGIAAAGSYITDEMDEWSDLDLVIITKHQINADKAVMLNYANRFGKLLAAFTGEHVGEKRLLICLYDDPLLHVDLKFLTLDEFRERIENPVVLLDRNDMLKTVIDTTTAEFPLPNFQWIEDRFWVWVHYTAQKIARGEYFEAMDAMSYLRGVVFGPLLHLKNHNLPRGVRKVETALSIPDLTSLQSTVSLNDKPSLLTALCNAVELYRTLRQDLFADSVAYNHSEAAVSEYLQAMKS